MALDWDRGGLAEGLRCYCGGSFFEAHEHWEEVWLAAQEPEKSFLQGLIQVAAAFHHYQQGNRAGTASLLAAALGRLERYTEGFGGIALPPLREEIRAWLGALDMPDEPISLTVPVIRPTGRD